LFCYIHIPFCQSRCKYCRFSTFVLDNDLEKEIYVNYLRKEIENNVIAKYEAIQKTQNNSVNGLLRKNSQWQKKLLNSIYFWWWTPTSLKNNQLEIIIQALNNKFGLKDDIEITLETTISNISEKNLVEWKKFWINRLSLWIQTLNNQSLKEIWRPSREEILEKLDIIKDYLKTPTTSLSFRFPPQLKGTKGESSLTISLDFILWLPYVKKWEVLKDIQFIIKN
jgi:oxygen-independent coproporphyrinogen-3 oxidase